MKRQILHTTYSFKMKQQFSSIYPMRIFVILLLLAASCKLVSSQTIVENFPGFPGPLPSKLETGYIGVGKDEAVQLFYFFVESEGNPEEDPLIIWLAGGPGCSNLHAFFFEIGPFKMQFGNYIDDVPALELDPNSWTKVANIIYLDAPTLTGYSYTTNQEAALSSDTLSASQTTEFIRKFVRNHPKFLRNDMYVTGISYSGIVIPMITDKLYTGNEEGLEPIINIKGYIAGNPLTDRSVDLNSRFEYAYKMGLIPNELFQSVKRDCNGDYTEAGDKNLLCITGIDEVNKRVKDINTSHILEPKCKSSTTSLLRNLNPIRIGWTNPIRMVSSNTSLPESHCFGDYDFATRWANNKNVMNALNIRQPRLKELTLCNMDMKYNYGDISLSLYDFNVHSVVGYHKELSKRNCRALIFSGDHDMVIPYTGTSNWINSLNLTITNSNWDAWYSNGQVAGFKTTYAHNNYSLVFATIKGGGHTAPQYKPKACFDMAMRWFAHSPM